MKETADIDESNNSWPKAGADDTPSKFGLFKARMGGARGQSTGVNPMQNAAKK
jgi:hypothetical protein